MATMSSGLPTGQKRRLSGPDQLMLWGLITSGLIMGAISVPTFKGGFGDFFLLGFYLVSIALVATGLRWAFLAPAVLMALIVYGGLMTDGLKPFVMPAAHWRDFEMWLVGLPVIGLFLIGAVIKLIQIIRRQPLHLPKFTPYLIVAIVGFALGGNLLAVVNR
ncbi:MAG TPA: hypothetical protein VFN02_05710 [Ktedonobacteraceae bacterium]|nr:hypothetical protein [Ktedonobacteraceae bacterium]